jgi:SAM-dependent methyltransferase
MSYGSGVMEHTLAYRLWQRPFQEQKFAPIQRRNDLTRIRRVLDVGCGPGTNAHHFEGVDYLGVDVNKGYIDFARERYGGKFLVADITEWSMDDLEPFDFVFANSFFHHVPDDAARTILRRLAGLVAPDGYLHVLDLVLPERRSVAQLLARWDRGDFPRPIDAWGDLLSEEYEPTLFEPFELTAAGVVLWQFVYFKGQPRRTKPERAQAEDIAGAGAGSSD